MVVDPTFPVESANFMQNRGYVFEPNNNLSNHYHPGLRNHELSYGNKSNVQQPPQQYSFHNAPPGFQGQGATSSNYQGQKRQPDFEENALTLLNDMKKNNDDRSVNLEKEQVHIKSSLKTLENQMGQLTH